MVQATCTVLLVQSLVLQYQVADVSGFVEEGSKTGLSPASGASKEEKESERKAATCLETRQYADVWPFVQLPELDIILSL